MKMKKNAEAAVVVEKEAVERDYGFLGCNAVVDHPRHGRLLVCDAFAYGARGEGCVRWESGAIYKLQPADTLSTLKNGRWNESVNLMTAVINGYDDSRPLLLWPDYMILQLASSAGL
jgi:hypothetical protein